MFIVKFDNKISIYVMKILSIIIELLQVRKVNDLKVLHSYTYKLCFQ